MFTKYKAQIYQAGIFTITASLYSTLHASRTAWAYAKPTLAAEHDYSDTFLSMLDFSFLCAYAIGLFINGWLGDRLRLKILLCQGMLVTVFALVNFSMLGGLLNINSLLLGIPLFALLGLGQSTAFPGCITILTNWFLPGQRGLVFGVWMTNINLGNILGQQLGKVFIDIFAVPWPYLILSCGGLVFLITLIVIRFLHVSPSEVGLCIRGGPEPSLGKMKQGSLNDLEVDVPATVSTADELPKPKPRAIGFWEAWKLPGVFLYSVIYVCTKSTTSGLLFWLPTYLKLDIGFKEDTATLLACMELGSLVGVIILGYLVDKIGNKSTGIFCSLFGAFVIFFALCFMKSPDDYYSLVVLLFLAGLLLGGPGGLIVGALSSDLGENKGKNDENSEEVKATSTITGIIDGSGTVGAAVIQPIIPFIRSQFFVLYTVLLLIATILTPFAHRQALGKSAKGMAATDQINQEAANVKELEI